MPLTDTECRKAQPKDKQYRLSDSHGLSLIITTKGQKYWNVRVTVHGERKSESLGLYPDLSLKKARELAYELKHRYSRSVLHEELKPYFKEVAEDWFNNQKETWSSKHISNVRASLDELYIALANKRINQIQAPEILQIIKKIEARGSLEIAKRTLSRCGMVMKYAIAHGYRYDNPAGDLVYALKNKRVKNLASLPESEMPEFLKKVRAYPADAQTHHAIILIMLTGVRVSELLQAQWEEFDLEGRKWDIPEERMKNRLPHRVPLTDMMIAELQALRLTHMWLTGFDVPFLDTIYIDKPLQKHSLIQTISRVNRKFEGKESGLVVDYIGIKKQMNLALSHYTGGQIQNLEDIQKSVVVVKDHLNLLDTVYHKFDSSLYFNGTPLQQLNCLNAAADFALQSKKLEKRFMDLAKRLKSAYDICVGSSELTKAHKDKIHYYLAIRTIIFKITTGGAPDVGQMNQKVRDLVKDALLSDGVEEIFKLGDNTDGEIDIFDEDYLAKLEVIKQPNTKLELLQQLLAKAIGELKKTNKVKGVDFSKKMNALVEKYNDRDEQDLLRAEVIGDFSDEIIKLYHELREEMASFGEMGIDFEEKAFYDILLSLAHKYDFTYPEDKLIELSKEVKKLIDEKAKYTDWNKRDDIKAELQFDLMVLLDEWGYPPVDSKEVYKEIFEQAENFKRNRNVSLS